MKMNPDPDQEDPLLEAVLRDDAWQSAHTARKAQALGVFRGRQRVRRLSRWAGSAMALVVVILCVVHWRGTPVAPTSPHLVQKAPAPPLKQEKSTYLTDDQLLALFPEGSCFLAEVDGKKKLIFFDPKVEREYVSDASGQRSFSP